MHLTKPNVRTKLYYYGNLKTFLTLILLITICTISQGKNIYGNNSKKVDVNEKIISSFGYVSEKIQEEIANITNEDLGVGFINVAFQKFKHTSVAQNVDKALIKIVDKLELKINESFTLLNKTREIIEKHFYATKNNKISSFILPCNNNIDFDEINTLIMPNEGFNILELSKLQNAQKSIKRAIKQQYFLSNYDVQTDSDALISKCRKQDKPLLWKNYMSRVKAKRRNVMILIDHGGSLTKQQFKIVKALAKQMISYLREDDRVGLLALSDVLASPVITDHCLMPNETPPTCHPYFMTKATKHNKNLLNNFIDSLPKGTGATSHSLGFQQALQTIKISDVDETVLLVYVSRGLFSSLTESKTVLETIAANLEELKNPVIINTCAVIDETKNVMYEIQFLREIALQNYTKYNISLNPNSQIRPGLMLAVNSTHNVGLAAARFYNTLDESIDEDTKLVYDTNRMLSLPTWDDVSKDTTITLTIPCGKSAEIGVLGLDIHYPNFVEDITYYSNYPQYTYAFIIDNQGNTIMHPSYPRPITVKEQPLFVDIQYLEKVVDVKTLREMLLSMVEGKYEAKTEDGMLTKQYAWRKVSDWYTVCIVVNQRDDRKIPTRPYKLNWNPTIMDPNLVYYRLDLDTSTKLCRHLNQIATLDAGSLYLSSSCFQSPTTHSQLFLPSIQTYMAYLKDKTRLLANPGLREEVRDDVVAMSQVIQYLRKQHLQGSKAKYVVRRYVTSPSGVLQVFPGTIIPSGLEPTKRNWYLRSVEYRYKTILTPPYLDGGGAGYIVTIAYATSHLVTAMDVTFGYIYRLLLEYMPSCGKPNTKCFMMDDRGYLIYHPNLIDPNGHGPIEQQHIIHKESLVANDILNHKDFVKKMLCNSYSDGTIQRYYRLNTSLDRVLGNAVHGEHCVKYHVSAIKGTNVFVGVVKASCEVFATFCPCSMIDRLCLNCNRMEQKECECPCECPLNLDTCTHPNKTKSSNNPVCPPNPEGGFAPSSSLDYQLTKGDFIDLQDLQPCLPISCEAQTSHETCLGVLGCEWCRVDVDGESLLASPFCTSIRTCFNGVLGSPTPYGDQPGGSSSPGDLLSNGTYSPVGPVIGSVFGVCLGLVLLFFCYRSYTSPTIERFYLNSSHENRVRMSDVNVSDDYREDNLDRQDKLLLQDNGKKPEPVSPYCVTTGYRRPVTAVDSDHGYSTMTPHDESEHLSFAPLELDSLEDESNISDATSVNTSVSSRQPQAKHGSKRPNQIVSDFGPRTTINSPIVTTNLSGRNRIVAPVTVHRNMEMT